MAGKQQGYDNALGSIFDMVFSQKKAGGSRKPPKLNGVNASDEFTRAIMDIASSPGINLSKQAVDSLNATFGDGDVLKFYVDKKSKDDESGRVRIKVKDIRSFMDNPTAVVDKALEAAAASRKTTGIIGHVGKAHGFASTYNFARRNGLNASESMLLAGATLGQPNPGHQEKAVKSLVELATMKAYNKGRNSPSSADFKMAQKLAKQLGVEVTGLGKSQAQFFGTNAGKGIEAGIKKGKGYHESMYVIQPKMILAGTTSGPSNEIAQKAFENLHKDAQAVIQKAQHNGQLTKQEKELYDTYLKDVNRLVSVNDKFKKKFDKFKKDTGSNLSYNDFAEAFNGSVDTYKGFVMENGMMLNDVLIPVQAELNREKFETSGDSKYYRASKLMETTYRIKDKDLGKGIAELTKQIGLMEKEAKQLKVPVPSSVATLRKQLSRLEKSRTFTNAWTPKWRNSVVGGQFSDSDSAGNPSGGQNSAFRIAQATSQMHKSWGEIYEASGKPEMAKVHFRLSRSSTPGAMFNFNKFYGRIKYVQGLRETAIDKGGFWPALLGGSLWDQNFGPSVRIDSYKWKLYGAAYKKDNETIVPELDASKIILPRDDFPIYRDLTGLYYMMPGTMIKTLFWNGEGVKYAAVNAQRAMVRKLYHGISKNQSFLASLYADDKVKKFMTLADGKYSIDPRFFHNAENLSTIMDKIKGIGPEGRKLAEIYVKYSKSIEKYVKWAKFLARPSDIWRKVMTKVGKIVKAPMVTILRNISKRKGWRILVDKFESGSVGFYQLIETVVGKAIQALGLSTGPLGTIIAALITSVVMKVAMTVIKPFLHLGMYALRGALALIFLLLMWLIFMVPGSPPELDPLYGVMPYGVDRIYPEDIGLELPITTTTKFIVDPNATCPVEGIYYCGGDAAYHAQTTHTPAVDVSSSGRYWYAPTEGTLVSGNSSNTCRTDGCNYGGIVKFEDNQGNLYTIIHAKPIAAVGHVEKGRAVAEVQTSPEITCSKYCWTGEHWHLDVKASGGYVDAKSFYEGLGCNIPACWQPG